MQRVRAGHTSLHARNLWGPQVSHHFQGRRADLLDPKGPSQPSCMSLQVPASSEPRPSADCFLGRWPNPETQACAPPPRASTDGWVGSGALGGVRFQKPLRVAPRMPSQALPCTEAFIAGLGHGSWGRGKGRNLSHPGLCCLPSGPQQPA